MKQFFQTTPQEKHIILTISLPLGITPQLEDCNTWGSVFAAIYTKTHGVPSLAVIPEVLKQITDEYGTEPALDLGMKLLNNFKQVSTIILSNIKGEAAAVAILQRLRELAVTERQAELIKITEESYAEMGRDSLGKKALQTHLVNSPEKDTQKQTFTSSKRKWENKKENSIGNRTNSRGRSPQKENPDKRYNLRNRDNIKKTDRYQDTDTRSSRSFKISGKTSE